MSVNWQDIAFSFLGGLGLFLFSIKYMGDGLQQAAGDKLRFYIDIRLQQENIMLLLRLAQHRLQMERQ